MYTNYSSNGQNVELITIHNSVTYDLHGFCLKGEHLLANAIGRKGGHLPAVTVK